MSRIIFALLLVIPTTAFGQWDAETRVEVKQTQVVFLQASAAQVAPIGEGTVAILAENLAPERSFGVIAEVPATKWLEIHDVNKPFPPVVAKPIEGSKYLIRGEPGQKFYVSGRGGDLPLWFDVQIAPSVTEPDPPTGPPTSPPTSPPPAGGLAELTEVSRGAAAELDDLVQERAIKAAILSTATLIEQECAAGQCRGLDQVKSAMVLSIDLALQSAPYTSKSWAVKWRRPVSDAIKKLNPADVPTYIAMMRAAAAGLKD